MSQLRNLGLNTALRCLATLAVTVGASSSAFGALAGYEGFSGYTAGADIAGQTGTGSIGFSETTWSGSGGGNVSNKIVQSTGLQYTNGGTLVTSGGAVKSSGTWNRAHRGLTTAIDPGVAGGGSLWMSYLFQSGPNTEDANQMRFYTSGTDFDGQRISADVTRRWAEGTADHLKQTVQPHAWTSSGPHGGLNQFRANGETNLILLQYTLDDSSLGGNQGVMRMYVNPVIGGAAPADDTAAVTWTGQGDFDLMNRLSFASPGGGGHAVTWDEIRWGSTFAAVTPVPEPASLALLALGGGLMALRRRNA